MYITFPTEYERRCFKTAVLRAKSWAVDLMQMGIQHCFSADFLYTTP